MNEDLQVRLPQACLMAPAIFLKSVRLTPRLQQPLKMRVLLHARGNETAFLIIYPLRLLQAAATAQDTANGTIAAGSAANTGKLLYDAEQALGVAEVGGGAANGGTDATGFYLDVVMLIKMLWTQRLW